MITIPDLDGVVAAIQDDKLARAAHERAALPYLRSRRRPGTRLYSWINEHMPVRRVTVRREVRNA